MYCENEQICALESLCLTEEDYTDLSTINI